VIKQCIFVALTLSAVAIDCSEKKIKVSDSRGDSPIKPDSYSPMKRVRRYLDPLIGSIVMFRVMDESRDSGYRVDKDNLNMRIGILTELRRISSRRFDYTIQPYLVPKKKSWCCCCDSDESWVLEGAVRAASAPEEVGLGCLKEAGEVELGNFLFSIENGQIVDHLK
jgi:hypothetical protein